MKKYLICLIILLNIFSFVICSAESDATEFRLVRTRYDDQTVNVALNTDKKSGVGGINLEIAYDVRQWEVVNGSSKSKLNKSVVSVNAKAGTVQLLWDTTDDIV